MAWKIEITKTSTYEETTREWKKLRDTPYDSTGDTYGYAEPITVPRTKSETVYEQTVDSLDLQKVIMAVNGMKAFP